MIKHWLISTIAIIITAYLLPGVSTTLIGALVVAVVLGLLNTFIKPIVVILTLPLTIVTLGLFYFVINALMVLLAAEIVPGFAVSGFISALLFALILSLVQMLFRDKEEE
jgi:putative membrane protein